MRCLLSVVALPASSFFLYVVITFFKCTTSCLFLQQLRIYNDNICRNLEHKAKFIEEIFTIGT